jgi:hypothetical protein
MTSKTLFFSALSFFVCAHAEESTFTPKTFILQYAVQSKDANTSDLENVFNDLANTTKKNDAPLFQTFLTLLQNAQGAIAAGLNLFATVSTSQESAQQICAEVVEAALEAELTEASQEESVATQEATKSPNDETSCDEASCDTTSCDNNAACSDTNTSCEDSSYADEYSQSDITSPAPCEMVIINAPTIILSISITVTREEDLALFEAAINALTNFVQDANNSFDMSEDVTNFINQNGRGMLSVTSVASDSEKYTAQA